MGNGATAIAKQAAVTNGRAPGYLNPAQLHSNILPERIGVRTLAAALVDVSSARLRERASLLCDEHATSVAAEVSATAAPIRLSM